MKKSLVISVFFTVLLSSFLACELIEEESDSSNSSAACNLMVLTDVFDAEDGSDGNAVGEYAQDFAYRCVGSPGGDNLSSFRGNKVVLVKFWYLQCPYCMQSMPKFEKLHKKYSKQGLLALGMNVMDSRSAVDKFAEDYSFVNAYMGGNYFPKNLPNNLNGVPLNMLIDKNGVIRHISAGLNSEPSEEMIEELLSEL